MKNLVKKTLPTKWLEPTKSGKSLMDVLLERIIVMYPSSQSFFITPERVQVWMNVWAEDFIRHGIMPEDIKRGLEECTNDLIAKKDIELQFMPSLPQFIHWCKLPVKPAAHRNFPKIEHRLTDEERKQGLKRLHIAAEQLTKKENNGTS